MNIFISAGEPSGDLHGSNLIRALLSQDPTTRVTALGGPLMRAAGANLMYPLTDLAVMWLGQVVRNLPTFFRVGELATYHVRTTRPDAVVMIDYPGFNFALAKRIREFNVPTYYFVPPQVWAWKRGRVRRMRKLFTKVLTSLPFEDEWYRARHVNTEYIGHPYFDELAAQRLDAPFVASERAKPGVRVAILPGSRNAEVSSNAEMMLAAARKIHAARPDTRFLVAAFNERQAGAIRAQLPAGVPIDVYYGRTAEIIELADTCVSVSGSVSLELLYRAKPTVIVYRLHWLYKLVARTALGVKYITLVNLLANEELFPELLTARDESDAITGHVLGWLNDPTRRAQLVARLTALRERVAVPGACERAAAFLLGTRPAAQRAAA